MFSITYTPMDVKDYLQPALTAEDRDRLDAADAYYMDAGDGWHIFGQACGNPTCTGYWQAKVHESHARMFQSAIDRACNTSAVCNECWRKGQTGPSLIKYAPKSASSGGNGGNGTGRGHRNRQSRGGDARVSKRQIEARIKQLAAMIANPGQTPDEVIAGWQAEQEALAYALATYPTRKRRAA